MAEKADVQSQGGDPGSIPPSDQNKAVVAQRVHDRGWRSHFQLELRDRSGAVHRQSRSWISSIVLHLLILLTIALVFAPSDFGGSERHEIVLRFRSDDGVGVTQGDELDLEIDPVPIEESEPVVAEQVVAVATSGADGGGAKSDGEIGPRGTFFGIEASGHQIVYIVDISGSMNQKRLQRAIDELVRSVEELDANQSFYIYLFSNSTKLLFDDLVAKPIPATPANKLRVRQWLDNVKTSGGTDPREALARAIRLSPSAIFILSDGKFDAPEKCKASLISGKSDAFDIVAGSIVKPPVHAIAFEDIDSCENMKRLAKLSDGQYRFVGNQDNEAATAMLTRGKNEIERGNYNLGMLRVRRVAKEFSGTEAGWEAREMVADVHHENALVFLELGDGAKARAEFELMVSLDPEGIVTGKKQHQLMMKLIAQAKDSDTDDDRDELLMTFADLVRRYGRQTQKEALERVEPFVRVHLDKASRLAKKGRHLEAIEKLLALKHSAVSDKLNEEISAQADMVAMEILNDLTNLRRNQSDRAYGELLQQIALECVDIQVKEKVNKALQQLAENRDGSLAYLDRPRALPQPSDVRPASIFRFPNNPPINNPAANNPRAKNVPFDNGEEDTDVELEAMRRFIVVLRSRRTTTVEEFEGALRGIITKYPDTFTARQAKNYLSTPQ